MISDDIVLFRVLWLPTITWSLAEVAPEKWVSRLPVTLFPSPVTMVLVNLESTVFAA